jgi:hypothetical protein
LFVNIVLKQRVETERQRWFHLLERMVVATDCSVSRKERMWQRISSGKVLIISSSAIEIGRKKIRRGTLEI